MSLNFTNFKSKLKYFAYLKKRADLVNSNLEL